jgi:hypothetical protein
MQFVVERICPIVNADPDPAAVARLPMVIWVELPASPPPDCGPDCGGPYYQLTTSSVKQVYGRIHSKPDQPLVCEHMGRLIE